MGLCVEKGDGKLKSIHLFFADDTMLFCEPDEEALKNINCTLVCFEVVSGLKINLSNFELAMLGDDDKAVHMVNILGCKRVSFPIRNLGLPLGAKYKDYVLWDPIVDKFESGFAVWKRDLLSKGGRLIKCTLVRTSIYMMSLASIPVSVAKRLGIIQCNFL